MRLIDADKITFFNCLAKTGNAICCHAEGIISKSALEMQPTVEAIPIEWMYEWRMKNNEQYNVGVSSFSQMISDWEKENEHNKENTSQID